jgi:hypothetical protein
VFVNLQKALHRKHQSIESISKAEYWQQLCPDLHVNDLAFQKKSHIMLKLSPERVKEVKHRIEVGLLSCFLQYVIRE